MRAMTCGSATTEETDTVIIVQSTVLSYMIKTRESCRSLDAGRNHTTLDPDDGTSTFWDFTWDEMAARDVPAFISLVTETTGAEGIAWVGHSEGTIQMFAAASDLNPTEEQVTALSKVKIFAALAPVAYVSSLASNILVALAKSPLLADLYARG